MECLKIEDRAAGVYISMLGVWPGFSSYIILVLFSSVILFSFILFKADHHLPQAPPLA